MESIQEFRIQILELLEVAIGHREYTAVSGPTSAMVALLDQDSRPPHYYYEYNNDNSTVVKVWRFKDWQAANEHRLALQKQSEVERQKWHKNKEKIDVFKLHLRSLGKSEDKIEDTLKKIFVCNDPLYYDVGVKFGLIDPATRKRPAGEFDDLLFG